MTLGRGVSSVVALGLFAIASSGCANNAIFTLELDVPPAPATPDARRYLVVEGRPGMEDWLTDWQQWQAGGIELDFVRRTNTAVDFVGSGGTITEPLRVKIRFCVTETCTDVLDGNAPEERLAFERVFYQGRFTRYSHVISAVPTPPPPEPVPIGKCEIQAPDCIDGTPTTDWCIRSMTSVDHFCER